MFKLALLVLLSIGTVDGPYIKKTHFASRDDCAAVLQDEIERIQTLYTSALQEGVTARVFGKCEPVSEPGQPS